MIREPPLSNNRSPLTIAGPISDAAALLSPRLRGALLVSSSSPIVRLNQELRGVLIDPLSLCRFVFQNLTVKKTDISNNQYFRLLLE